MQNEEKVKLEQRIIQYFDGSLNGEESKSLLADVSKSTESRALFKGYESLQRIISAARVPMEMPMEAKRSIADRIPGLIAFIPGLLGGAQALPVITQSANPFFAFLSKIPISTAISVGTSAVVLTTAGIIVKNKIDDNAALEQKAKTAIVQNHVAQPSAQVYAELPKRDVIVPEVGHGVAAFAAANETHIASQRVVAQTTERTHGTNRISNSASNAGNVSATNVAKTASTIAANTPSANAASVANDIPANTPAAKSADEQPTSPAINLTASPRPVPSVAADIPGGGYGVLRPMPEMFGDDLLVEPFIAYGGRAYFSNVSNGVARAGGFTEDVRLGLDIPIASVFAIRVQGGNTQFAHETSDGGTNGHLASFPIYSKFTLVNLDAAYWATAGVSYQLYAADAIPLTISAGFGFAFLQTMAPMFDLVIATEIPVSSNFTVRPGLSFQAASTSETAGSVSAPPSNAIIQNSEFSKTSMWSNSIGFNVGITYRY